MIAMTLAAPGAPLVEERRPDPAPGPGEIRLRVRACGVCRTDLHVVDGDLPPRRLPITPGHEVVGLVDAVGAHVSGVRVGDRVGAPWLAQTCGRCRYCKEGQENLCDDPAFNGWTRDGGYADMMIARADFCLPIPPDLTDVEAAPLLCAGLIGFRAWRKACADRPVRNLGLYGFGAAAHLLAQLAVFEGQSVHAFTRDGDAPAQALALALGCAWAGGSGETPPTALDAAIIFAPAGDLVPLALRAVRKGGVVVCGGIHMSDIPSFSYALLWEERRLVSVANLTRQDGRDYLPRAVRAGVRAHVTTYPLDRANQALEDLRGGAFTGAGVLVPDDTGLDHEAVRSSPAEEASRRGASRKEADLQTRGATGRPPSRARTLEVVRQAQAVRPQRRPGVNQTSPVPLSGRGGVDPLTSGEAPC